MCAPVRFSRVVFSRRYVPGVKQDRLSGGSEVGEQFEGDIVVEYVAWILGLAQAALNLLLQLGVSRPLLGGISD